MSRRRKLTCLAVLVMLLLASVYLVSLFRSPTGELLVDSNPPGSVIFLDGQRRGVTPQSFVLSTSDPHEVYVESAGRRYGPHRISLLPGEKRVLSVSSDPQPTRKRLPGN